MQVRDAHEPEGSTGHLALALQSCTSHVHAARCHGSAYGAVLGIHWFCRGTTGSHGIQRRRGQGF